MRQRWGFITAIIIAGAVVRILAARGDLWFDEIYSWQIAMQLDSPTKVFTAPAAQIDNNHPLNTLFIRALGDQRSWQAYRILSIACGIGVVILAVVIARRSTFFTAALFASSYPLILYSSEARGYAPMIFFMLLALFALQRDMETPRWQWPAIYAVACVFAVIAHLIFLQFLLSAIVWSSLRNWKRSLAFHAIPLLAIAIYYFIFVRHLKIAGGPDISILETVASTFSLLVGGGENNLLFSILGALIVIPSLVLIRKTHRDIFTLTILTILAAPMFLFVQFVILNHRDTIFPRYFLVPFTFALLAIGHVLGDLYQRHRLFAITACLLLIAANLWQTAQFLHFGRGHYSDAVQLMAAQTSSPVITVTTEREQQFRVRPLLAFYQRYLPSGKKLAMEVPMSAEIPAPQWLIINTKVVGEPIAPDGVELIPGRRWKFVAEFPYYGLSGWAWQLYRVDE